MEKLSIVLLAYLGSFAIVFLGYVQSQSDFISIDCGLPEGEEYTDPASEISYISDAAFVATGKNGEVAELYKFEDRKQLWTLRSFPEGIRNCYTIKPAQAKGNRFLIRARFYYGDYDSLGKVPVFDVYMGPNLWATIDMGEVGSSITKEIIHVPSANYIEICLLNTGLGTPLISSLEIRFLKPDIYKPESGSLMLFSRLDIGSLRDEKVRYKDDIYDRMWLPLNISGSVPTSTSLTVDATSSNDFQPPQIVMQTAGIPINASEPLQFDLTSSFSNSQFYVYMHFAEIQKLQANQTREFNIYVNGSLFSGPIVPDYLSTSTVYSTGPIGGERIPFSIDRTERSTLPPIINALEIYTVIEFLQSETNQKEVDAILNIKSSYGVKRNWQGDPCVPKAYLWKGLSCSYDNYSAPKITALNLSASGLEGGISAHIADLTSIEYLDLSDNELSGHVPNFLSQLKSLRVLNLKGNKLTGPIPDELSKRSQSGKLELSVDGPINNESTEPEKKKESIFVPIVASFAVLIAVLIALTIILSFRVRRMQKVSKVDVILNNEKGTIHSKNRQLTYADVKVITNNFERVVGEGGFGTVYYGLLDGNEVAVKMLSTSSAQGYEQLQAEVTLLMRVHHRNLTSLVGYCNEETNMALIYEYMLNGDLSSHLSAESTPLCWEDRLRIAVDAANGLEYLHHGCKPPIIHRDIKSTNILLDGKLQAKLADFGFSRSFLNEGGNSCISTKIVGTPGYLDPEYYISNRLHEKSDVYSYGIVLLEIITCQPMIRRDREKADIAQWVSFMVEQGDDRKIIDPRLYGDFDTNSAWKFIELALSCASPKSSDRPAMNDVVVELKLCLEMELARKKVSRENTSKDSVEMTSLRFQSTFNPMAR